MADVVTILTAVIAAILIIFAALYFLVYFQHPEDKWVAWFPKVVIVVGLSLAAYNILLLPLDVGLQKGEIFNPDAKFMSYMTVAFYSATAIICIAIVPFVVFWYEGLDEDDDPDGKSGSIGPQIAFAIKWTIPMLIALLGIIFAVWFFFGWAEIKLVKMSSPADIRGDFSTKDFCGEKCVSTSANYTVRVNAIVYFIACVTFLGYCIFSVFGGVGLFCLPLDLIQDFIHRPKAISAEEYDEKKRVIGQQAQILNEVGQQIMGELKGQKGESSSRFGANAAKRKLQRKEAEFRKDVLILEIFYRRLEDSYKNQGGNLLVYIAKLIGGLISVVLTVFWILHILMYTIFVGPILMTLNGGQGLAPLANGFLNDFFDSVSPVPVVGIFFYGLFSFYLLFCVIKGVAKLGMRLVFITLHPMRVGETMMNSLVFNVGVILISSLAVANFCTNSFSDYARFTASQSVFSVQITYLQGLGLVIDAMTYVLLGFFFLSAIYIIFNPYKKQRENRMNFKW